uniref:Tyrosine-protein phosphatase domain-containing protein n=1 Tax=Heterorhabditis bacteriophora TaxID=37862 RepID=A0A1I7W7E5_HETBA
MINQYLLLNHVNFDSQDRKFGSFVLRNQYQTIVSRVASKKLGEGVLQLHKEFVRETSTYFAYWNAANTAKNFKPDRVLLYDWNRVVLTDGADYYHASFVDGCVRNSIMEKRVLFNIQQQCNTLGQYILAQAPFTKDTQRDFFRLVNQTKPDAIILMERADSDEGRLILPGKETKCGGITIKSDEEIKISGMDIHTLLVAGKQKVKVFCINGWNTDSETPKNLLDVHDKIRKMIGYDNKGILLIVCKDGVSRCGIFTLLDIEAERIRTKSRVKLGDTGSRVGEASSSDYRVAVFGAGGVGKSSIVQRFVKGTFSENYVPTIEDTYRQVISCNQKNVCTLQITDTTGSHQFPAMQRLSISKGHAFLLIYSVTSKQSLEELAPIITTLTEVKGSAISDVPIMLVGNKSDEQGTSAKNNNNISELFQTLLAMEKKRTLALTMDDPEGKGGKKKRCTIM